MNGSRDKVNVSWAHSSKNQKQYKKIDWWVT